MASLFVPFPLVSWTQSCQEALVLPQCWQQSGCRQDPAHTEQPELCWVTLTPGSVLCQGLLPIPGHSNACQSSQCGVFAEHPPACTAGLLPVSNNQKVGGSWTWQTLTGTWCCPLLNIHEKLICAHVSRLCFSLGDFFVLFFLVLACSVQQLAQKDL